MCQTILSNHHKNSDLVLETLHVGCGLVLGNIHCNEGQLLVSVLLSIWTELFPTCITREHRQEKHVKTHVVKQLKSSQ